MGRYLTFGEYHFLGEIEKNKSAFYEAKEMKTDIFTPEEVRQICPVNLTKQMVSFYLTSLTKKRLIHKIRNGLYYIPTLEVVWEPFSVNKIAKYVRFKKDIDYGSSFDEKKEISILWLGIDKVDRGKIKAFWKLYRDVMKNNKELFPENFRQVTYKKVKFLCRQEFVKGRIHSNLFQYINQLAEKDKKLKKYLDIHWDLKSVS